MSIDIAENLRNALQRRRITTKSAAYMAGRNVDVIERILLGHTQKIDAQIIVGIAEKIAEESGNANDIQKFIGEVFKIEIAANENSLSDSNLKILMKKIADIGEASNLEPQSLCFDDQGMAFKKSGCDIRSTVYEFLKLPPGKENIVDFATKNLGFVVIVYDSVGILKIKYHSNSVSREALIGARNWVNDHAHSIKRIFRDTGIFRSANDQINGEFPSEALSALERKILLITPLRHPDWVVERRRLEDMPKYLQEKYAASKEGLSPIVSLAATNNLQSTNVYSVANEDATALQMSSSHFIPTSQFVGRRLMDRPKYLDYSAIVNRHLVESLSENEATVYYMKLMIGDRQREYWRLAIPEEKSGLVVSVPWEP